jgi:hypothetical protein
VAHVSPECGSSIARGMAHYLTLSVCTIARRVVVCEAIGLLAAVAAGGAQGAVEALRAVPLASGWLDDALRPEGDAGTGGGGGGNGGPGGKGGHRGAGAWRSDKRSRQGPSSFASVQAQLAAGEGGGGAAGGPMMGEDRAGGMVCQPGAAVRAAAIGYVASVLRSAAVCEDAALARSVISELFPQGSQLSAKLLEGAAAMTDGAEECLASIAAIAAAVARVRIPKPMRVAVFSPKCLEELAAVAKWASTAADASAERGGAASAGGRTAADSAKANSAKEADSAKAGANPKKKANKRGAAAQPVVRVTASASNPARRYILSAVTDRALPSYSLDAGSGAAGGSGLGSLVGALRDGCAALLGILCTDASRGIAFSALGGRAATAAVLTVDDLDRPGKRRADTLTGRARAQAQAQASVTTHPLASLALNAPVRNPSIARLLPQLPPSAVPPPLRRVLTDTLAVCPDLLAPFASGAPAVSHALTWSMEPRNSTAWLANVATAITILTAGVQRGTGVGDRFCAPPPVFGCR